MIFHNITTIAEAARILKKRGIGWDRVVVDKIKVAKHYLSFHPNECIRGVHKYFMSGDSDVAYFTEATQSLMIHETPRKWDIDIEAHTYNEGYSPAFFV